MLSDIERVLFDEKQLEKRVKELGKQISDDYSNKNLLLVCILKGSVVFFADLMKAISIPLSIDFMQASSYGSGTVTSGQVKIKKDLENDLAGKDVLIVEDIIDSGITLKNLTQHLESRNPASLRTITLLDKKVSRQADFVPDYIGFEIPNEFIVGYGLDYDEKYRNLPFVGILKRQVYSKN